jgi:hypothetical protein
MDRYTERMRADRLTAGKLFKENGPGDIILESGGTDAMSGQTEVTQVGELLLARMLVAGDKGATGGEFKKALEPLLGHRWIGAALSERIERTLAELATAGLVARIRKPRSKTGRDSLTPEGRRRALEVLGLDQLPPKTTWDQLKKTALVARALDLSPPKGEEAKRFGTDNGFKAALLKSRFGLPLGAYPKFEEALDALAWTLMGFTPERKFNVKTVQAALIRRALGDPDPKLEPKPDPKKEASKLLAKEVGARQSSKDELRLATLRHWSDQEPVPAAPEPSPPTPLPSLDLDTFAHRAVEAARSSPSGRFGDNKVFVVHVWRALQPDPAFAPMGLDGFKRRLAEANNARLLDLSRADMVEAMDPEDVRLSEVAYLGASFHFVRV